MLMYGIIMRGKDNTVPYESGNTYLHILRLPILPLGYLTNISDRDITKYVMAYNS